MQEYKNGDLVEFRALSPEDEWHRAVYIGPFPDGGGCHVVKITGDIFIVKLGTLLRPYVEPKVKKEGWMFIRTHQYEAGGRDSSLIYDTKEAALNKARLYDDVVDTIKVEWYE